VEKSFDVNFFGPLELVQFLIKRQRKAKKEGRVIFFAGGGVNSSTPKFSSYTLAKIALIKATELLDSEIDEFVFSILGPGWVKTKIHNEVIKNGQDAELAFEETNRRFESNSFNSMQDVTNFIDWVLKAPAEIVSGKNFSIEHDPIENQNLLDMLSNNDAFFKLRRFGNDWRKTDGK